MHVPWSSKVKRDCNWKPMIFNCNQVCVIATHESGCLLTLVIVAPAAAAVACCYVAAADTFT